MWPMRSARIAPDTGTTMALLQITGGSRPFAGRIKDASLRVGPGTAPLVRMQHVSS